MKKFFVLLILISAIFAEMPNTVAYRGQLTDETGNALDATVDITFNIFDVASGGTSLWSETQSVSVTDGFFDIELGSVTALDLNFDSQYWVELTIDGETLSPRDKLTPTAFAIRSNISNKADSSVYSVSSSADHSGRIGHVRFIPGDGGSISEAAASSETDTIYIAIGGGTGSTTSSTAYPPANVVLGQTTLRSTDISNNVVYTVPSGNICYIYSAEVSLSTSDNGDGIIKLDYFDGTDHVFIHTSSAGYVSGYGASTFGNSIGLNFNPPLLLEQGDQVRFSYDGNGYSMYIGWSFTGWEGTE